MAKADSTSPRAGTSPHQTKGRCGPTNTNHDPLTDHHLAPPRASKIPRQSEDPIDIINDRLLQARSTLDLIKTGLNDGGFVESLYRETLAHAVYSAILRIEEAMEAAETLHKAVHS